MSNGTGFPDIGKILGAATALMAAAGVGSGVAVRMLRNFPALLAVFVVVMVGGTLIAILIDKAGARLGGFIAFVVGLGGLTWLAGKSSQAKERPLIIVSSETTAAGLIKVTTAIKADGLTMKELIYVAYRGTRRVPVNPVTGIGGETGGLRSLLGQAAFGPSSDGSVEGKFTFEISPSLYWDVAVTASRHRGLVDISTAEECIPVTTEAAKRRDWSCARFILPLAPLRPQVSASITPGTGTGPRTITANVASGGVAPSRVIVVKAWTGSRQLLDQALGPDLSGAVKATITTTLKAAAGEACIVAALVPSATHASSSDVARGLCDRNTVVPETVGIAVVR